MALSCPSDRYQSYPNMFCIFDPDMITFMKSIFFVEDCVVIVCMVWLTMVSNKKIKALKQEDPYNHNNCTYCQLTLYVFQATQLLLGIMAANKLIELVILSEGKGFT